MSQSVIVHQGAYGTATGVASPRQYCATFRVKAGPGHVGSMASQLCEDDTTAEIIFPGDPAKLARATASMLGSLISSPSSSDGKKDPLSDVGSMMTDLMAAFATQTAPQMDAISGVIRMADVVKADSLALELTLANGQQPIILLHPQAPVIKSYLAKCMSVSPVPDRPNSLTNAPRKASPTPVDKADSALVFSGTPGTFAQKFPELVKSSALKYGLDPQAYQNETAYITDLVNTCAQITPKMARGVYTPGIERLSNLGKQYADCISIGDTSFRLGDKTHRKPEMFYSIAPLGDGYRDGQGFGVRVSFVKTSETIGDRPALPPGFNTIVSATIVPSHVH